MNILLSFYISHMNWKPSGRRYGCNNLIKFACVCVCVYSKHAGYFQSKERRIEVYGEERLQTSCIQDSFEIFSRSDKH